MAPPTSELVLLLMKQVAIISSRWHAVKEANNCSPIYNLPIVRDLPILIATTGQVCQTCHVNYSTASSIRQNVPGIMFIITGTASIQVVL